MPAIDHRALPLNNPALVTRPLREIVLQRQRTSLLGMQRLHVDRQHRRRDQQDGTVGFGRPALKLGLPCRDLVGVNVERLGQLRQCPITMVAAGFPFALSRCRGSAGSSLHGRS